MLGLTLGNNGAGDVANELANCDEDGGRKRGNSEGVRGACRGGSTAVGSEFDGLGVLHGGGNGSMLLASNKVDAFASESSKAELVG